MLLRVLITIASAMASVAAIHAAACRFMRIRLKTRGFMGIMLVLLPQALEVSGTDTPVISIALSVGGIFLVISAARRACKPTIQVV